MRKPPSSSTGVQKPVQPQQQYQPQQHVQQQQQQQTNLQQNRGGPVGPSQNPSIQQLQDMAMRQQQQIESQQQMLVAKEQRLKYLRQQDMRQNQMAAEYERLRRLREKVEAQEMKLRKLRALRGQKAPHHSVPGLAKNSSVSADLEAIRSLFNEKEKELTMAVHKVEDLTHQLDDLRSGRYVNNHYPPQMVELERLRRELAYRKQLNEQQNNMITQQRAQLSMGHEEIAKIDNRIVELQERLTRKRMMNQQLANQISAATSAKQAQLRAIQQGMANNNSGRNKNKPVSTVEPFQRRQQQAPMDDANKNIDPKYGTLPYGTKLPGGKHEMMPPAQGSVAPPPADNNNGNEPAKRRPDHLGNFDNKPVSSVAPVLAVNNPMPVDVKAGGNGHAPQPVSSCLDDSTITVAKPGPDGSGGYSPPGNLSVSAHPAEEGTSVDDDMPSASDDNEDSERSGRAYSNVHISINRRIEMPPAFHFPEDQTPPSDLLGATNPGHDVSDNAAALYNHHQMYTDFDVLGPDERNRMCAKMEPAADEESDDYPSSNLVPEVVESEARGPMPPGIIKKPGSSDSSGGEGVAESRSRRISFDPLALLLDASLEGELELVKKTAREVPDPSAANDEGITALHNAICAGHQDIVQFLVEFGCDVNAQDSDGWTPLHCAASCNNLAMVRFLVERGACIFATTLSDRETAAEKCEEDEDGFEGCSEYLRDIQQKLGLANEATVYSVYDFKPHNTDELGFDVGDRMVVVRRGDELEQEWWWCRHPDRGEGYIPRNLLGLYPRVQPDNPLLVVPTIPPHEHQSEEDDDVNMSSA